MNAEDWLREKLLGLIPLSKTDTATRAWRTESLFVKFFPFALENRAAVEAEISSEGLHPSIVPSLLMTGCDDGIVLAYPWVSGVTLRTPEAREKFYALPETEKLAALHVLFLVCTAISEAGWILVDMYEGNLIYDFENKQLWCFDWDLCVKAESYVLERDRNWGSSRLMAPEEFALGARIDARTNVFNLGRIAQLALGKTDAALTRATDPDPEKRFPSVRAFQQASEKSARASRIL
jgi:serine/threonine protein kinase